MGTIVDNNEEKRDMDDSGCVQDDSSQKMSDAAENGVNLLDLSDDVLLYILRHCSPRDLKALGYSCARLGRLVRERSLWRRVDARSEACSVARLKWYITHALHADTSHLYIRGYAAEARGCLGLLNCSRKEAEEEQKSQQAQKNGPVKSPIRMQNIQRHHACFYISAHSSSRLPRFRGSPLWPEEEGWGRAGGGGAGGGGCRGPQFSVSEPLLRQLRVRCARLTRLALERCNINCNTTNLGHLPPTLTRLSLCGTKCFNLPIDKSFLFKIQDHLPLLESLDVSECEWLEPAALLPLSKHTGLKELYMRDCHRMTEFVAYASLSSRYGFRQLQILDLRGSPVGDSEVAPLAWLPELRQLKLSAAMRAPPATHAHYADDERMPRAQLDRWEMQVPEYFQEQVRDPDARMDPDDDRSLPSGDDRSDDDDDDDHDDMDDNAGRVVRPDHSEMIPNEGESSKTGRDTTKTKRKVENGGGDADVNGQSTPKRKKNDQKDRKRPNPGNSDDSEDDRYEKRRCQTIVIVDRRSCNGSDDDDDYIQQPLYGQNAGANEYCPRHSNAESGADENGVGGGEKVDDNEKKEIEDGSNEDCERKADDAGAGSSNGPVVNEDDSDNNAVNNNNNGDDVLGNNNNVNDLDNTPIYNVIFINRIDAYDDVPVPRFRPRAFRNKASNGASTSNDGASTSKVCMCNDGASTSSTVSSDGPSTSKDNTVSNDGANTSKDNNTVSNDGASTSRDSTVPHHEAITSASISSLTSIIKEFASTSKDSMSNDGASTSKDDTASIDDASTSTDNTTSHHVTSTSASISNLTSIINEFASTAKNNTAKNGDKDTAGTSRESTDNSTNNSNSERYVCFRQGQQPVVVNMSNDRPELPRQNAPPFGPELPRHMRANIEQEAGQNFLNAEHANVHHYSVHHEDINDQRILNVEVESRVFRNVNVPERPDLPQQSTEQQNVNRNVNVNDRPDLPQRPLDQRNVNQNVNAVDRPDLPRQPTDQRNPRNEDNDHRRLADMNPRIMNLIRNVGNIDFNMPYPMFPPIPQANPMPIPPSVANNYNPVRNADNAGLPTQEDNREREPRHRVLYVNVGQPASAIGPLPNVIQGLAAERERILNLSRSHIDPASLLTDTAIRRFGRATSNDIRFVLVGIPHPFLGPNNDGSTRPERSNLEVLVISGYRTITDRSLIHLATAAPYLRHLDCRETNVTAQGVENFRSLRPDCEVLFSPYVEREVAWPEEE